MVSMIAIGVFITVSIGLVTKLGLDAWDHQWKITWLEFGIGAVALTIIVIPLTTYVGFKASYSNNVTFHEFHSGYELSAQETVTTCEEDGSCEHRYACDPYVVSYDCSYRDSNGDMHYQRCYRTEYHSCPYCTTEHTFTVATTLGEYTLGENWFPANPQQHRWEPERDVPLEENVPSGIPVHWQQAKDRIDSNQPGPVAGRYDYDNLILASQQTILKRYSQAMKDYESKGLLPNVNATVKEPYLADRVYFVNVKPAGDWQQAINYLDAAVGRELQGDVHLVIANANDVGDPDNYSNAVFAYWQSPYFDKDAISKNGIMVVIGTKDGVTVDWARAATGMPVGNEHLSLEIQDRLKGAKLDPQTIIGPPKADFVSENGQKKVHVVHSQGLLDQIIWGQNRFQRVHMHDYRYLINQIRPNDSQSHWIYFAIILFGCVTWGTCIAFGPRTYHQYRPRTYSRVAIHQRKGELCSKR